MKSVKRYWIGLIFLMAGVSLACRLTSPTPASWSGTPSAEARHATNTAFALTQDAKTIQRDTDANQRSNADK